MRLRNGESPGMGNHHEIPRSSGCRLRHPDTKKNGIFIAQQPIKWSALPAHLRFASWVCVVCMTRPDL